MRRRSLTGLTLLAVAGGPAVASADVPAGSAPGAAFSAAAASAPAGTTTDASAAAASPATASPSPTTPDAQASAAPAVPAAVATAIAPATAAALTPNSFSVVGRAKIGTNGTITLVVRPQAAGKFLAFATTPAPVGSEAAAGASARPSPQPAPLPLPYGTATTIVPAGAQAPLYFRPGKAGREALIRLKRPTTTAPLRVTLAVAFVPPGGVVNTVIYVVKVSPTQIKTPR